MNATPSSGRCYHQKSPASAVDMFDSVQPCPGPGNVPGLHALRNAQLRGDIPDQTKGLSRWDSDTNRAPLCKEPQGECLKDAASGWTERSG